MSDESNEIEVSELHRVQLDVGARLEAALEHVAVTVVDPLDAGAAVKIQSKIDKQLAGLVKKNGKAGIAALVLVPEVGAGDVNLPGPQLRVEVVVRVIENPLVNRGANGARVVAEVAAGEVLELLHHWSPRRGMLFAPPLRQAMVQVEVQGKIAWDVRVESQWPRAVRPALGKPIVTVDEETGLITLAAAEGAAIRYTLDGSYPTGESALYTGPFVAELVGPFTVRAVAMLEGFIDSSPVAVGLVGVAVPGPGPGPENELEDEG
jgi:hypothetical protein